MSVPFLHNNTFNDTKFILFFDRNNTWRHKRHKHHCDTCRKRSSWGVRRAGLFFPHEWLLCIWTGNNNCVHDAGEPQSIGCRCSNTYRLGEHHGTQWRWKGMPLPAGARSVVPLSGLWPVQLKKIPRQQELSPGYSQKWDSDSYSNVGDGKERSRKKMVYRCQHILSQWIRTWRRIRISIC